MFEAIAHVSATTVAQAANPAARSNDQLQLLVQGWVAIAMLAAIGALGLALIAVLLAVWRRSLQRQRQLEEQVREMRSSLGALGDAWAASATRIPGFTPRSPPTLQDEEVDDESDPDDDDPYDLFGGRDPLDRDDDDDEDQEDGFDRDDDDRPPPGF